jgi:hypothetical protein
MKEAPGSSETSVLTRGTRRNNPEDTILNAFMTAIQEAAWNSTPIIKTKLKGLNFPIEIRNRIAEKRKLRRKWHQSRYPYDKNLLNRASQQLSKEIKTIKHSSINKFLTELTQDSSTEYSLWKATKYLKRPIAQVPPIKKQMEDGPVTI